MSIDELAALIRARLDEDERVAREASGGTVVGEVGNWQPAPGGDEWEVEENEVELLVALRPGLPRPPEALSGYWGAVVHYQPDDCDPDAWVPLPQFRHAALQDPARTLREAAAKRALVDALVAEPHAVLTPGGSTEIYCAAADTAGAECDCGRHARVHAYLTLLAQPYSVGP